MFLLVLHPVVDSDQEAMGTSALPRREQGEGTETISFWSSKPLHCLTFILPLSIRGSVYFILISARAAAEKRYSVCSSLHLQPHVPAYASTRAPETPIISRLRKRL